MRREVPNERRRHDMARWFSAFVTLLIALLAFTVQWGVVTGKLEQVEKRLDELIIEARGLRTEYHAIERRVSFLEVRRDRSTQ